MTSGHAEDNEHGGENATGVTPAQLILNNSISLSSQILQSQRVMYPPDTTRPVYQIALSDRMDEADRPDQILTSIVWSSIR